MSHIQRYLETNVELESKEERRKLRSQAVRYIITEGELYRRSFTIPYLMCLKEKEAKYAPKEIYDRI